ncbi:MAG: MBOAT family O-acyltransferase [Planctomycetota bacterium]
MIFTEARFFAFFALAFGVHWALRSNASRKAWLLACSYAFYAAWDWRFLSLILFSTVVDFAAGARLAATDEPRVRRRWLGVSLACNLGLLGAFKYYNFFADSAARLLEGAGLGAHDPTLNIVLPVGISFYTFQTLSYTIDIYYGRLQPARRFLDLALFVAFFPQLVAGPIVRASQFLPQLAETRRFLALDLRPFVALFLVGFFKKACVADNLAAVVDPVFAAPAAWSSGSVWLALALYTIQFYCDFSGYTDMALATAGLLGYRLTLNFDFPYLATSMTEFWRRWHMSLSSWFRDYLYIPLGGNQGGALRTARNLSLVFLLCGLWHGANWTFVVFGLYHGALLSLERVVFRDRRARGRNGMQLYVVLAWAGSLVFFRSPSVPAALAYFQELVGLGEGGGAALGRDWWLAVPVALALHLLARARVVERFASAAPRPIFAAACGAAFGALLSFVATDYQPFIYFQF